MILKGKIVAFDYATWWGKAVYDLTVVDFHGTSVRGATTNNLPHVGQSCNIILNDEHRLLSIECLPDRVRGRGEDEAR